MVGDVTEFEVDVITIYLKNEFKRTLFGRDVMSVMVLSECTPFFFVTHKKKLFVACEIVMSADE